MEEWWKYVVGVPVILLVSGVVYGGGLWLIEKLWSGL